MEKYEICGEEWEKDIMKMNKKDIVELLRKAIIEKENINEKIFFLSML